MRGQRRILLQIVHYIKLTNHPIAPQLFGIFFPAFISLVISSIFIKIATFLLFISETFTLTDIALFRALPSHPAIYG